ncbi:hypothetical protein B0H14DRAFT_3465489 [Mycena olivaceomarginata]|nr:hypothetical protein B0H14DRAFT_3465489 [Mycena olivaceomarginata]
MSEPVDHDSIVAIVAAGILFRQGRYAEAVERYNAAILVDGARSPVYLTNLAAALPKLERFETAETTAHRALELDPTSVKARYRRAMARRALGKLPESLLDLYSLLVTDPGNREARSAYAAVLEIYNLEGKRCLSEIEIFIANAPAAHVERNIILRLSGELLKVEFLANHLRLYALRALEFAPHARPRVEGLLNVHVEMVAAPGEFRRSEQRRRLSIREINAAPLDIIPDKDIQQFHEAREEFCAKMGPEVLIVAEKVVSRTRLCLLAIPPDIVAAARAPNAAVEMYSHSLGKDVLTPVTLENIYGHMEDELRLDTNNYYRMRG